MSGRERPRFVSHCKFRLGLGCICELHMCRVGCACACACACCVSVTMGPGYGSNSVRASLSSKSGGGESVRIQKENLFMPLLGESLSSKSERKHFSMPLLEGVKPYCCREFSASLPKTPVRCMISSERGRHYGDSGGGDCGAVREQVFARYHHRCPPQPHKPSSETSSETRPRQCVCVNFAPRHVDCYLAARHGECRPRAMRSAPSCKRTSINMNSSSA